MLVVAVGFFGACSGAAIALMARRAAKFVRVVRLQQVRLRMASERAGVLVRLFALEGHGRGGEFDWLANSHVGGFAAIPDVGFGRIGLEDFLLPRFGVFYQTRGPRRP